MKSFKKTLLFVSLLLSSLCLNAGNCNVHLMVVSVEQGEIVPEEVNDMLVSRLETAVTATGAVAGTEADRFFVTGKISHIYKDVVAGPPMQHVIHSTLTLYIGDAISRKVYATAVIELRGVGTSETRAYVNAFSQLNAQNDKFSKFVKQGTQKVLDYYNNEYKNLLKQAQQAAALHDYEQALSLLVLVPECSCGYDETSKEVLSIYDKYIDYAGRKLLAEAKGAWAASPDSYGAEKAYALLNQIDPDAACYGDAVALHKEMKKVVKENWDFENKKKYNDEIDIEKRKVDAARAVGVAYGNGQKEQTTNLMWLK